MVLKLLGYGWAGYISSGWNIFDCFVTLVTIAGIGAELFGISFVFIIMLRPLRLLRLFKMKKSFRDVFGTCLMLLPRMLQACGVLLIVYYFYAIIGMELFAKYNMKNNPLVL